MDDDEVFTQLSYGPTIDDSHVSSDATSSCRDSLTFIETTETNTDSQRQSSTAP